MRTGFCGRADVAGNSIDATTSGIDLDETKPVIGYSGQEDEYSLLDKVDVDCTASDALSGLAVDGCTDIDRPAYLFEPGPNTFSASATDKADNVNSAQVTFTVDATYNELCTLTTQFADAAANTKPLCQQLTNAQRAEADGNDGGKRTALDNFDRLVTDGQARYGFSDDEVVVLRRWSGALRAVGCARCTS